MISWVAVVLLSLQERHARKAAIRRLGCEFFQRCNSGGVAVVGNSKVKLRKKFVEPLKTVSSPFGEFYV